MRFTIRNYELSVKRMASLWDEWLKDGVVGDAEAALEDLKYLYISVAGFVCFTWADHARKREHIWLEPAAWIMSI